MSYKEFLPYTFALVLAFPFLVFIRQGLHYYMKAKAKELELLTLKKGKEIDTQAHERMAIFLERIKPAYLIQNFDKNLATHEFLYLTEKNINQEFEYNISQQIYIDKVIWENITDAKNSIIKLLKDTYQGLNEASLEEFKTVFLMSYINGEDYIGLCLDELRKEILKAK
ncbi:hypothetical protein D1000_04610 [Riemerella anatipestifer]|uniref:DUF7935 family protein n=1 Tax=Riemerella anatipestifer TaxID=34085 RepID=UPI00129D9210|nr:hypothetical protein [Riemerella anatipestifer]MDR7694474.1 hypothetical protein [Riemerella anatipestifer]MDR7794684.1 hypothetical protein [Riemerella anatipestifer]MRN16116.1 hypothetical protein [Riemerella anatipestifer]